MEIECHMYRRKEKRKKELRRPEISSIRKVSDHLVHVYRIHVYFSQVTQILDKVPFRCGYCLV